MARTRAEFTSSAHYGELLRHQSTENLRASGCLDAVVGGPTATAEVAGPVATAVVELAATVAARPAAAAASPQLPCCRSSCIVGGGPAAAAVRAATLRERSLDRSG